MDITQGNVITHNSSQFLISDPVIPPHFFFLLSITLLLLSSLVLALHDHRGQKPTSAHLELATIAKE
ncbi:hypothetical protein M426DRAFT_253816 [Hypoxylon sp. CI-4A]|nr:hypothetical protein M426DRAFT_253816 [Hypoxylon sp. CI-4A]